MSCQPTSIAPFRAAPFKFSWCPNFAVATSSDKSLWVQTGRSVQLQDASAGGPEEGCRALFIHKRCRGFNRDGYHFVRLWKIFQHNFPSRGRTELQSQSIRFCFRVLGISGLQGGQRSANVMSGSTKPHHSSTLETYTTISEEEPHLLIDRLH